jgi:hypothetical protein
MLCPTSNPRFVPNPEVAASFNHLVGCGEQRRRNGETKCLGGLEINDQLEFRWLFDWDLRRFSALENFLSTIRIEIALGRQRVSFGNGVCRTAAKLFRSDGNLRFDLYSEHRPVSMVVP